MSVITVNKENFQKEVMESDRTVLIDFWASWCGPCRMVSPIVDEIADEHPEIKVCKINVDEENELAAQFGVMSIPSLFVVKEGKVTNLQFKKGVLTFTRECENSSITIAVNCGNEVFDLAVKGYEKEIIRNVKSCKIPLNKYDFAIFYK
jgi:thioredoxin 1